MNYIQNTQIDEDPRVGDLAINEEGALGVITYYAKLNKTCVGVHISNDYAPKGSKWTSENPRVIGCVDNAQAFVESLKDE